MLRIGVGGGEGGALVRLQLLFRNRIKSSAVVVENGVGLRVSLPVPDRDIDEGRLVFTHLSLNKDAPVPRAVQAVGRILPTPILGGLHHQYVRI